MAQGEIRYWGYRIHEKEIAFLRTELNQRRLRQGWGYNQGQDLRNRPVDAGVRRNQRMFDEVKKGHILLVPHLPYWGQVAIVEATEDWNTGYRFAIPEDKRDYGHIFPARLRMAFSRHNEHVVGDLRSTLRNPARFWNIDRFKDGVKTLLDKGQDLTLDISDKERFENAIQEAFMSVSETLGNEAYVRLNEQFSAESWENALIEVLEVIYPGCDVRHTAGGREKDHGTDILIEMPGLGRQPDRTSYAIAVQVKDHEGTVSRSTVEQIAKAKHFERDEDLVVVEKVVLMTKANKTDNAKLVEAGAKHNVRFVFADDLKEILADYASRRWA